MAERKQEKMPKKQSFKTQMIIRKIYNRYQYLKYSKLKGYFKQLGTLTNGKIVRKVLPRMVFWRKRKLENINRYRMMQCIYQLNADICHNRGSFYLWGKIIAQRIVHGKLQ